MKRKTKNTTITIATPAGELIAELPGDHLPGAPTLPFALKTDAEMIAFILKLRDVSPREKRAFWESLDGGNRGWLRATADWFEGNEDIPRRNKKAP